MKRIMVAAGVMAGLVAGVADAKTLEELLKEKGTITEAEYKELTGGGSTVSYTPAKGFTFTTPDQKFQLSLDGRIQTRYTLTNLEKPVAGKTSDSSTFEVKRLKFWLTGYAYTKDLTYLVQADFTKAGTTKFLEEAYVNYKLIDEVQLLAGQNKVQFGRQYIASDGQQEFVDRSVATTAFAPGYDMGAMLNGRIAKGIVAYSVAGYGGAGQNTARAVNDNALAARVVVNPLGDALIYTEGDIDMSDKPLVGIGSSYFMGTLYNTYKAAVVGPPAVPASSTLETNNYGFASSSGWLGKNIALFKESERLDVDMIEADLTFRWKGLFAAGEYYWGEANGRSSNTSLIARAWYAQAGYMVIPKKLEAAFRYSEVDWNKDVAADRQQETQGAVSYYFDKHNLKIQGDVTNIHKQQGAGKSSTDDMQYRLQAQVIF